jgi:hypothetical protein
MDDETWKEDAYLAEGAYTGGNVDGYTIDPELSNEYATTYIHNNSKKATVAFSGTNFSAPGSVLDKADRGRDDVVTDLYVVRGNEQDSPRFKTALDLTKRAIAKHGLQNVHVTGHSLGGTTSAYISSQTGVRGTGFNSGWSPMDVLRHSTKVDMWDDNILMKTMARGHLPNNKWNLNNFDNYVVPGDSIASSARYQPGMRIHEVHNTVAEDRLHSDLYGKGALQGKLAGVIASANPVTEAVQTGLGVYTLSNDVSALHSMNNFLFERKQIRPAEPPRVKHNRRGGTHA